MSENSDILRSNQRRAVEAMAAGWALEQVATEAGVTLRTLYRWRSETAFQQALRDLNESALETAATILSSAAVEAVQTLKSIMVDTETKANVRVAAARAILDGVLKIKELHDFERRLIEIERVLNEQETAAT